MPHLQFIVCYYPDNTTGSITIDTNRNLDIDSLEMERGFPGYNPFFISVSIIERIQFDRDFFVPVASIKVSRFYRVIFLKQDYPDFVLRVFPRTNSEISLSPWNVALEKGEKFSLLQLLEVFKVCFCVDFNDISISFHPHVDISIEKPVLEQIELIRQTRVVIDVTMGEKQVNSALHRLEVINEMISSETKYVSDLKKVTEYFTENFFKEHNVDVEVFRRTFRTIPQISPSHEHFLEGLKRIGSRPESLIGGIFLEFIPFFKVASPHVINFGSANSELTQILKKNKSFQKGATELCIKVFEGNNVESLLVTPVQRIPRYPLLLRDLKKSTPEKHWDYNELTKSITSIQELVLSIDAGKRTQEERNEVADLQMRFGNSYQVLDGARRCFSKLENIKINSDFKGSIFLFNDMVLIQKMNNNVFIELPLESLTIENLSNEVRLNKEFKIPMTQDANTFYHLTLRAKKERVKSLSTYGQAFLWKYILDSPPNLMNPQIVHLGETFYLFGSSEDNGKISNFLFALTNNIWKMVPIEAEVPPRYDCTFLSSGEDLILFGGTNGSLCYNDLWVYNTLLNVWVLVSDRIGPSPRFGHSASMINTQMWVFGGKDQSNNYLNDMHVFDFSSYIWHKVLCEKTPEPRAYHTSFWMKGYFSIFGGACLGRTYTGIWSYDIDAREWFCVDCQGSQPTSRFGHLTFLSNESVYIVGGKSLNGIHQPSYRLDLDKWKWNIVQELNGPDEIFGASCALLKNYGVAICCNGKMWSIKLTPGSEISQKEEKKEKLFSISDGTVFSCPIWDWKTKMVNMFINRAKSKFVCEILELIPKKAPFRPESLLAERPRSPSQRSSIYSKTQEISPINLEASSYPKYSFSSDIGPLSNSFSSDTGSPPPFQSSLSEIIESNTKDPFNHTTEDISIRNCDSLQEECIISSPLVSQTQIVNPISDKIVIDKQSDVIISENASKEINDEETKCIESSSHDKILQINATQSNVSNEHKNVSSIESVPNKTNNSTNRIEPDLSSTQYSNLKPSPRKTNSSVDEKSRQFSSKSTEIEVDKPDPKFEGKHKSLPTNDIDKPKSSQQISKNMSSNPISKIIKDCLNSKITQKPTNDSQNIREKGIPITKEPAQSIPKSSQSSDNLNENNIPKQLRSSRSPENKRGIFLSSDPNTEASPSNAKHVPSKEAQPTKITKDLKGENFAKSTNSLTIDSYVTHTKSKSPENAPLSKEKIVSTETKPPITSGRLSKSPENQQTKEEPKTDSQNTRRHSGFPVIPDSIFINPSSLTLYNEAPPPKAESTSLKSKQNNSPAFKSFTAIPRIEDSVTKEPPPKKDNLIPPSHLSFKEKLAFYRALEKK